MADGKFASLQECMVELPGVPCLNIASKNEHEPCIEQRICVVKVRARSIQHSLPFTTFPKQLKVYMIFYILTFLNSFSVKGNVSDQFSPKANLAGKLVHYKYHSMSFGTYCQIHEEDAPCSSMVSWTQVAISLGFSGNVQSGHKFLTLNSGHVVTHGHGIFFQSQIQLFHGLVSLGMINLHIWYFRTD